MLYINQKKLLKIYDTYKILNILEKIILKFSNKYQENKKRKEYNRF